MGWVGRLVAFTRRGEGVSDATTDTGGGVQTAAQHFSAPGDDGAPLPGDYLALVAQQGTGRTSAVGYVDPLNAQTAEPGEKRIYARDPDGVQVSELWMKGDGTLVWTNGPGSLFFAADGTATLNGVIISPEGAMKVPDSLKVNDIEVADHDHAQENDSGGNIEQDVGPMK